MQKRRCPQSGDRVIIVVLWLFGVGNLVIPASMQSALGIDYVVIVFGGLSVAIVLRMRILLAHGTQWLVCGVLAMVALAGCLGGALSPYGVVKVQTFVLIAVVVLGAAALHGPTVGTRSALIPLAITSLGIAMAVLALGTASPNGRVSVFDLNPIGIGRVTVLFVVIVVPYMMMNRRARWGAQLLVVPGVVVCVLATVATGSRGPLVAAGAAVLFSLLLVLWVRQVGVRFLAAVTGSALVAGIAFARFDVRGFSRVLDGGDSGRSGLYDLAVHAALENPGGIGWGNFGRYGWKWGTDDVRLHPHNVFLEVWVEGGVLALFGVTVILVVVLVWATRQFLRVRITINLVVLSLYVYALVNAQFSSDIVGNRLLWVSMATVIAMKCAPDEMANDGAPGLEDIGRT